MSELEIEDKWWDMEVSERIEILKEIGCPIFQARHDNMDFITDDVKNKIGEYFEMEYIADREEERDDELTNIMTKAIMGLH